MDLIKQKETFEKIYNKEVERVFRFVIMRVSSREDALDITEDAFYKLWQSMQEDRKIENHLAFLFTITRNKIIDWYRKKKAVSLEEMLEGDEESGNTDLIDPDSLQKIDQEIEVSWVLQVLKKLNPRDAEIIEMRFVEGLQPQEIAERMNTSANSISIQITRAVQKLRKELNIDIENDGK